MSGRERRAASGIKGRQVHLGQAAVDQQHVGAHEVVVAFEREAQAQAAAAPLVTGFAAPHLALQFGEQPPALGDLPPVAPDQPLGHGIRIFWDVIRVADLSVPVALPDRVAPLAAHGVRYLQLALAQFHTLRF